MKTQKTLKKVTDRKILTSLPLLRLEKEYLNAAKEKDHSNAKKIIKSFHQNYFPNLTVTGRRKLGVIMGDNVATGINSSINSGTIVGNNVKIGPNTLVSGTYESKSIII